MLSFDHVGEIRMIDENEFVSKLGMRLQNFRSQMSMHSFRKKTTIVNEKSETIYRSLLVCNDASNTLNFNCKS